MAASMVVPYIAVAQILWSITQYLLASMAPSIAWSYVALTVFRLRKVRDYIASACISNYDEAFTKVKKVILQIRWNFRVYCCDDTLSRILYVDRKHLMMDVLWNVDVFRHLHIRAGMVMMMIFSHCLEQYLSWWCNRLSGSTVRERFVSYLCNGAYLLPTANNTLADTWIEYPCSWEVIW